MSTPPPSRTGLTAQQVLDSRTQHGANVLTPPEREPWWKEYFGKFDDPVIRILMVAATIAIAVGIADGHVAEGIGIIIAILLATGIAFWNERRAAREFDILNQSNDDVPFKVLRDGSYGTVPRRDLVVGDLVYVEIGEEVPADGTLLEATSLQVSEARLTGEARPVDKLLGAHSDGETYPSDRLMRGVTVVDGHGLYEVTAVGDHTEIGKTARESMVETDDDTPLNNQLAKLSKVIGVVGLAMAALTFGALMVRAMAFRELTMPPPQWAMMGAVMVAVLVALQRVWLPVVFDGLELVGSQWQPPAFLEAEGLLSWLKALLMGAVLFGACAAGIYFTVGWPEGDWIPLNAAKAVLGFFMIAVTIIVVAVPEGLAMSVTLSLAYSMRKMAAGNTLVRRMHACETIGAATVICSDKTGTLTENAMRVAEGYFAGTNGAALPTDDTTRRLVSEAIAVNTTAHLSRPGQGQAAEPLGNPTEGALLLWLDASGVDYNTVRTAFPIDKQTTFSTERKQMATSGQSTVLGRAVTHAKGAPEILLAACATEYRSAGPITLTEARRQEIQVQMKQCQQRGMRTLGFAYDDNVWLGFVAIVDPVRQDVPNAIAACQRAGVGVKIVTGDTIETASEVARQIGITTPNALTGPEFAALEDPAAKERIEALTVLARARPKDKMRLVTMLKERGHVVAVTGDGVNDGPALNHADVGLSMGKTGTAVAKEASDIVLLDDSFNSIVNAIRWGRSLYANIQRFILFQLTINVVALAIALLGPFIGVALPLTVMQMLWINLIMDTFAALALATEPADDSVMSVPPRPVNAFIVTNAMARHLFTTGAIFIVVLLAALVYFQQQGELSSDEISRGGTIFFTLFVLLQFWNLFNARCFGRGRSAFSGLTTNWSFLAIAGAILAGQVLIVQFGGSAFRTQPLTAMEWFYLIAGTSVVLWVGELLRLFTKPAAPTS